MSRCGKMGWLAGWLLLGLLWGCQQGTAPLPTLRVGHAHHDHHTPLFVAASHADYFRAHGGIYLEEVRPRAEYRLHHGGRVVARVLLEAGPGGGTLVRRLVEDQFDLVLGPLPSMIQSIAAGAPIRVLAPVMSGGNGLVLGHHLPLDDWRQLLAALRERRTPLRIGCKAADSVQTYLFEALLRAEGVAYSWRLNDRDAQVVLVDLHGVENVLPALEHRLVDGFVLMQPYLAEAEWRGLGRTVLRFGAEAEDSAQTLYPCCAVAARTPSLEQQGAALETLLALLHSASRLVREDPGVAARVAAVWLEKPVALETRALADISFDTQFSPAWMEGANAWVRLLVGQGRLSAGVLRQAEDGQLWRQVLGRDRTEPPAAGPD